MGLWIWGLRERNGCQYLQVSTSGLLGMHIYAGICRYSCILYCDINTVLPADQYREKQKGTKESRKAQIFLVNHVFSLCKISRSSWNKIRKRDKIPFKYTQQLSALPMISISARNPQIPAAENRASFHWGLLVILYSVSQPHTISVHSFHPARLYLSNCLVSHNFR